MRNLATLFFAVAVYVLMGIGGAAADDKSRKGQQRPDSIVTCQGSAGGYVPINVTTITELNLADCTLSFDRSTDPVIPGCSSCVRSLEKQGCTVLDVVVTNFPPASGGGSGIPNASLASDHPDFPVGIAGPRASFVLSCAKP